MKTLVHGITRLAAKLGRPVNFMEVCGTHTMVAFRSGLRQLLPPAVRLTSGPGCPVCVTDASYLDAVIELCRKPNVVIATFGDLMGVPGSESSLERERARGANVRVVYSPRDELGEHARVIGEVTEKPKAMALLRTTIGGERIIDMPLGEDWPRICEEKNHNEQT